MNRRTNRKTSVVKRTIASAAEEPQKETAVTETAVQTQEAEAPMKRERVRRKPMGGRNVLKFPDRPGYRRRVVNDVEEGARVKEFLEAGWEIVKGDVPNASDGEAGRASQVGAVVSRSVGAGVRGILMEIPEEWYNEDQRAKQALIDRTEESMKRKPRRGRDADERTGTYGEVKIGKNVE